MLGKIIDLDKIRKQGKVEQIPTKRVYPFFFNAWEGEEEDLAPNIEVEFTVENRVVSKMKIKISLEDLEAIQITKSADDCINEFFDRERSILEEYTEFVGNNPELNFILMQRFLFTAYNDLCDLDSSLENKELRAVKTEVANLYRNFIEYNKKIQYPLPYCFDKIFLSKQLNYIHLEQFVEDTKIGMQSAKAESEPLSKHLEEEERNLKLIADKKSREYLEYEKEVKALRRRLVDLIDYAAKQKEIIAKESARLKYFKEKHLQKFSEIFSTMTDEIKGRFIKLLNTKGYYLDKSLWQRAKTNQYVKKFFRDADIHGGYNSKTYLRYFLRGLDKNKVSGKTKELFNLLKSLEDNSVKNIMIIQENDTNSFKSRQLIERVDSKLKITVEHNPFEALVKLQSKPQDVVIIDSKISGLHAFDFVSEYKDSPQAKNLTFIVITPQQVEYEIIEKGRALGIEYFVVAADSETFSDVIRMAI
ncbi:response regulator [Helicobacter muridarum]|uniref:Response regulator n=1 Tax=Helicobacter muridarum TaxID=216 RepID=A0A099TYP5_9HELI|nr:response regulator [Helicobacter muridarum]TLE00833.1 response regulator [Helicobacter muridarum]STQ86597.1 response regulator PleD [Helicobacter muridarum]